VTRYPKYNTIILIYTYIESWLGLGSKRVNLGVQRWWSGELMHGTPQKKRPTSKINTRYVPARAIWAYMDTYFTTMLITINIMRSISSTSVFVYFYFFILHSNNCNIARAGRPIIIIWHCAIYKKRMPDGFVIQVGRNVLSHVHLSYNIQT